MIFDGMKFTISTNIKFRDDPQDPRYVQFYYSRTGEVIPLKGHSTTDMAYAKDGRVLLAHDGWVYTHPKKAMHKRGN